MELLTNNCGSIFHFAHCAVLVAQSEVDKRIVVAFKGTDNDKQVVEQVLHGFDRTSSFPPTGGQVMNEFGNYDNMYNIILSILY